MSQNIFLIGMIVLGEIAFAAMTKPAPVVLPSPAEVSIVEMQKDPLK
jgi:hypothetical protein